MKAEHFGKRRPAPQQAVVVPVAASCYCNGNEIWIQAGDRYRFAVDVNQQWYDMGKPSNADGYASSAIQKPWERGRRLPHEKWFALCGEVNNQGRFLIGAGTHDYVFKSSGRLCLFANDHPLFYWNNSGAIQVSIRREN